MTRYRLSTTTPVTQSAATVDDAYKGCVVTFKGHRLRVEAEPIRQAGRIHLEGREDRDGCPYVRRWYFANLPVVRIERGSGVRA